jgi:hypothetical protein
VEVVNMRTEPADAVVTSLLQGSPA